MNVLFNLSIFRAVLCFINSLLTKVRGVFLKITVIITEWKRYMVPDLEKIQSSLSRLNFREII